MNVTDFFGPDRWKLVQIDAESIPICVQQTISEDERDRIKIGEDGVVVKVLKARPNIIYSGLECPVKNQIDFERIKKRYEPTDLRRCSKTQSDELLDYYRELDIPSDCGLLPSLGRRRTTGWV